MATSPSKAQEGQHVERVDNYKYLGFHIDDQLNWHHHMNVQSKKLNQRLFFLRKLNSFGVDSCILKLFYTAIVQSIIVFGINCWGTSITASDKLKLQRTIGKAKRIVGTTLPSFDLLLDSLSTSKALNILKDQSHPLHSEFIKSKISRHRLIMPKIRTERYRNSFIPSTSKRLSSSSTSSSLLATI